MMAGIGALVAAIALATGTLDGAQIAASAILVLAGVVLFLIPQHST